MKSIFLSIIATIFICSNASAACSSWSVKVQTISGRLGSIAWITDLSNYSSKKLKTDGIAKAIVCDDQIVGLDALLTGDPGTQYRYQLLLNGEIVSSKDLMISDPQGRGRFGADLTSNGILIHEN